MSLQLVAQHLAQKGRGPDSTLVHMSNKEVAGLQALAQKHGGELSVNPETGLPEAGFLDSILPAVAGFGLSAVTGIDPITAGAIVGGITALDSKDLSKGLTAGLGAWGGAGMAGGLATLGGAENLATATPAQYGAGFDAFTKAPMASLSTLGEGSALKGSLPILAGLAPAAADMMDAPEEDEIPNQPKGYIRKYAFDPETGQYKQVGAYEAGGDPNKDVSSEAGTAGAFGGVGKSDYEKAHGMAEGGKTASDSERIYDYLMGRGENPMQFTHTQGPQVDYTPYMPKPITPTTAILDPLYDKYGNKISGGEGGGGYANSPEGRAEREKMMSDWEARDSEGYAHRNDWIGNLLNNSTPALIAKGVRWLGEKMSTVGVPEGQAGTLFGKVMTERDPSRWGSEYGGPGSFGPGVQGLGGITNPTTGEPGISGVTAGVGEAGRGMPNTGGGVMGAGAPGVNGDPHQGNEGMHSVQGPSDGDTGPSDGGETSGGYADSARFAGSSSDAQGGYLQHGQFDQRMARGGLPAPHSFYHQGKFNYKGPQVYADGGGIANLHQYNLGSYSDGGRLLKGPGDGVSDDIPATIGHGQPARLADGEFVIPARIVSEIGNGSTDAGARELYKMMDRIQAGRRKTVGKDQVARNSKAVRHLPA